MILHWDVLSFVINCIFNAGGRNINIKQETNLWKAEMSEWAQTTQKAAAEGSRGFSSCLMMDHKSENHLFWKINHQMLAAVKWKQGQSTKYVDRRFPHATEAIINLDRVWRTWLNHPANSFHVVCLFSLKLWYKPARIWIFFLPQVYKSFGLGSSYAKVIKFGTLLQYSEYEVADRDFPDVPPHLLEDIYQVQTGSKL